MDSTQAIQSLSGGGVGTDTSSAASDQAGSAATALFPYLEDGLPGVMGVPAAKIAAARKGLTQGTDWTRRARQFRWSEEGFKNLTIALGCPAIAADEKNAAPIAPTENGAAQGTLGALASFTVFNMNIPNQRLVLCRDASGKAVGVVINSEWRGLFRHGMKIEATQGAGGVWRTRKPRSVGRF